MSGMSAAAMPRPNAVPMRVPAIVIRLGAIGALALFGAQAWGGMVAPGAEGRVIGAGATGIALAVLAILAGRLPRLLRIAVRTAIPVGAVAAALLWAGVPLHLLDLESWGDLSSGLTQGLQALPGLNVPYRGLDEWNRIAMLLGGTAAAIVGVLVACWPLGGGTYGRPLAGVVVLSVLYAVPAVQLEVGEPFLEGAIFALLLGAALWGERLARRDVRLATVLVVVAALAGIALAPALDGPDPWVDYESIAQSLSERGTSSFSWNHEYGPLDWPRDGREVLRIRSRVAAYWKATTLGEFDGRRWVEVRPQGLEDDPEADRPAKRWITELRVSVRNLSTQQFISAGTTIRIDRSPRDVIDGAPGSFVAAGRPLRRGHAYLARAYIPRPRALQLEAAGDDYPTSLWPFLTMTLPPEVGGPPAVDPAAQDGSLAAQPAFVVFSGFGDDRPALGFIAGRGIGQRVGSDWVRASRYERMYALAQRLRERSESPLSFVRSVQGYLGSSDFSYNESPPQRALPLDAFVFEDKVGYCQQFSGAMALLLRMGGIPARVATGFSPGTLDESRGEYVVRDLDAHSWVEAYFPGYGWIPFDPTPAVAPPRAQLPGIDEAGEDSSELGADSASRGGERATDPAPPGAGRGAPEDGTGVFVWVALGFGALTVIALFVYAVLALRWRRRYGPEVAAAELARALRRTRRGPRPGATLAQLEEKLKWTPDAAGYVRAVRTARFGYGAEAPTRGQRRALRRELASGLGVRGRLRALWALPPF